MTGASGSIGGAVATALRDRGEVTGLSRHPRTPEGIAAVAHDLASPLPPALRLKGAVVIHCAAELGGTDWQRHWDSNVLATKNLLDWSRRHEAARFILFSSGSVYGYQAGRRMRETDPAAPADGYGHSKHLAESVCRSYAALFGLELVIFRLYFPFGAGLRSGVFRRVADALHNGSRLRIKEGGAPRMTPVHVADVVEAVRRATAPSFPPGCYNLCGDQDISFLELVRAMESRLGIAASLDDVQERSGDMMGDNAALRGTGWRPRRRIEDFMRCELPAAGCQ
ncbi:MAG: NAD(P)-dependent oxidoreductase [Dongiaceae bacterium]